MEPRRRNGLDNDQRPAQYPAALRPKLPVASTHHTLPVPRARSGHSPQGQNWVAVQPNEAIQSVEYRFQPNYVGGHFIYLTRYMAHAQTAVPDLLNMAVPAQQAGGGKKTDFEAGVETREANRCIISKLNRPEYPTVHSHLIPKALGPVGVQHILQRFMFKYSCEYPVTTALQGTLALPAILWLEVARATYSKISNYNSGPIEYFITA